MANGIDDKIAKFITLALIGAVSCIYINVTHRLLFIIVILTFLNWAKKK